jgi:hypothetical protein
MTAFVFLRTSFGYTFLRPKSVLLAFAWAFTLAFIVAWNEPLIWREYRVACIYTIGAVGLYVIHFSIAFYCEWRKRAREDHYPGTPHAERIARMVRVPAVFGETFRFWVEPGFVALFAFILRFVFGESHLSSWLLFVAFCMFGREAINHWTGVRRDKAFTEGIDKAKRQGETLSADDQKLAPAPKAVRTEPVERKRKFTASAATDTEARFGKILRLRPPFNLAKAEENYRKLIAIEQSDTDENSQDGTDSVADLNEAIEFFREKFGG